MQWRSDCSYAETVSVLGWLQLHLHCIYGGEQWTSNMSAFVYLYDMGQGKFISSQKEDNTFC